MREILGRRRMTRSSLRNAALTCATQWQWPVLPGAALTSRDPETEEKREVPVGEAPMGPPGEPGDGEAELDGACACGDPDCVVPGAHPLDPALLAATTDARMVRWWWTNRPSAPLILATGGRAPCALSLPAVAGVRALAEFDRSGVRVGPVAATTTRFTLLVEPYRMEELGELLYAHDWVPSSLRFHGGGGYVVLPPSATGAGQVRWERRPVAERGAGGAPWLPRMETLLDGLVEASAATPDTGSTLAY
ncbi:bifunctional DNA primase/polymerase [Streptomyces sp. HNM0574]|uniref:bifunctional DNA primase/polymerase n=1 Tax=Streptomyces sp. HNM0574 TaxID=2714954 RepID=UPI001469CB9B|nr:bifunctional DNA primase/polymerase [Streptomyces sp. HNM0574]NLU69647.1 DNA primase [Streptomyces sp. HNM0574]